jgi:hypothetical protein
MGQLYLVSVVALLVSNIGAQRAARGARTPEGSVPPSPADTDPSRERLVSTPRGDDPGG